jgi:N utilization substance protein B
MKTRRKASILAFQALFAWDVPDCTGNRAELERLLSFSWNTDAKLSSFDEEILIRARLTITGCIENYLEIDNAIKKKLENWDFSRLNMADRAILRFGTYLLLFQPEIPAALVIEDAIGLCDVFSGEKSRPFVHGVLVAIRKDRTN